MSQEPSPRWGAGFAVLYRAYAAAPFAVRLHALGRYVTCPFLRVLPHLPAPPAGARLLDLGAGHGTFSRLAAEFRGARAVAVEPDARKVFATFRHLRVRFVAAYADALRGPFDAVSIFDVLVRVPMAAWDPILASARDALRPGGVLLLKEIDPENRFKGKWNRVQEKIADLLGMTLGDAFSYETRGEIRARLERLGFEGFEAVELGQGYPHAHILYKAWRPG
jgi:SAM-dependent methyltransferase